MTQQQRILQYLADHPKQGMTIRDGFEKLKINWPHKRVAELAEMGVQIKRIDEVINGNRIRRYVLADPEQDRVKELLGIDLKEVPA